MKGAIPVENNNIENFSDDGCVECRRDTRFKIADEDKSIIFLNPSREILCRTRVDGCAIKAGPKADWVVSHDKHGHVIVEFKGHDIEWAYKQISRTAYVWRKFKVQKSQLLSALIIANRIPKVISQTVLQRRFLKEHRGQLRMKSYEDNLAFRLEELVRGESDVELKPAASPHKRVVRQHKKSSVTRGRRGG